MLRITLYQAEPASGIEKSVPPESALSTQSHESESLWSDLDGHKCIISIVDDLFSSVFFPHKGTLRAFMALNSGIPGGKMKRTILW